MSVGRLLFINWWTNKTLKSLTLSKMLKLSDLRTRILKSGALLFKILAEKWSGRSVRCNLVPRVLFSLS